MLRRSLESTTGIRRIKVGPNGVVILTTVRTGNVPRVMATLRSTAIGLLPLAGTNDIATATRHHARDATRPARLLLTC